jgi:hypothetical protein
MQFILPEAGRGTMTRSGMVEGVLHSRYARQAAPSTDLGGPPPHTGEDQEGLL